MRGVNGGEVGGVFMGGKGGTTHETSTFGGMPDVLLVRIAPGDARAVAHSTSPKPTDVAGPPPPPVIVATFLGFSPGQADQFRTLLEAFLGTLKGLEEQKKARQQALEQLVNSPNPNPAAIGVVVLQIHAIEQQEAQAVEAFHKAFLSLLTGEQLQKVQAVVQAAQLVPVVGAFQALYLVPRAPAH